MKRILLLSLLFFLSGCQSHSEMITLPDPVPDQDRNNSEAGVSLSLTETLFHGSPETIEAIVRNNSNHAYDFGDFYHIEVKKKNKWYILAYSDRVFFENRRFKDYGRTLAPHSEIHQIFSVKALGIELLPGEYRLVKSFSPKTGDYYKISIAVPFSVQ